MRSFLAASGSRNFRKFSKKISTLLLPTSTTFPIFSSSKSMSFWMTGDQKGIQMDSKPARNWRRHGRQRTSHKCPKIVAAIATECSNLCSALTLPPLPPSSSDRRTSSPHINPLSPHPQGHSWFPIFS
ncbi:hypothetical protein BDN70DRAFT_414764 [Pholiota conissans]|uniref:Uncharacterized protein n=1 Tax=Pholiota conissans TaxID=109636 RepID=A0A9P5YSQ8_9AGAR|nr:hypothetical protein BDN70DRAFT_414764 [Pholiota conissans]